MIREYFSVTLSVGNVLPVGAMPEGTTICNVEEKIGDRGRMARASGELMIMQSRIQLCC